MSVTFALGIVKILLALKHWKVPPSLIIVKTSFALRPWNFVLALKAVRIHIALRPWKILFALKPLKTLFALRSWKYSFFVATLHRATVPYPLPTPRHACHGQCVDSSMLSSMEEYSWRQCRSNNSLIPRPDPPRPGNEAIVVGAVLMAMRVWLTIAVPLEDQHSS